MTNDDVLYAYRLRVLASARELGSVAAACRLYGIHRSTFYRWKSQAERFGLEILRPRERRRPQMPNAILHRSPCLPGDPSGWRGDPPKDGAPAALCRHRES
jgi:hypothetical protein